MPQLESPHATWKDLYKATDIPCAATKTRHSQKKKKKTVKLVTAIL